MIIAYLRVSTTKQHLTNQQEEIKRYSKNKGIIVDKWVTDIVSGKTDRKKRNLNKVLKILKSGDTLIVTEISRLSRSLHEIMLIMKFCADNSVSVHSTKDGYTFDDSINSKVLSFAFGLAAEIEHKLISQRIKEALAVKKAEGVKLGRKKGTGNIKKILYDNKEEIISQLTSGETISQICKNFRVSYDTFNRFKSENQDIKNLIIQRKSRISRP